MAEKTLEEYLNGGGRRIDVARALNVSHSLIWQMIKTNRDIRVVTNRKGEVTRAYEIKEIGNTE